MIFLKMVENGDFPWWASGKDCAPNAGGLGSNPGQGKTRDLVKKIRDIKGTFHAKMALIKDRNGMDLRAGIHRRTVQKISS